MQLTTATLTAINTYKATIATINPLTQDNYLDLMQDAYDTLSDSIEDFDQFEQACMFLGLA